MRRRRRPPIRRAIRPRPVRPGMVGPGARAQRELAKAHRLMENGDYKNAAELFERLARGAHDRGMLRQAPRLYLQAGKANMLAGDTEKGSEFLRQGLDILAGSQNWPILANAGSRVVEELEQWGHEELAAEIKQWLQDTLPEDLESYQKASQAAKRQRPQLPLTCPSCGGPIRPDSVEWLDATTAECPYCGGGLRE